MASKLGDFFLELHAMPDMKGISEFGSGLKGLLKTTTAVGATIAGLGVGFFAMVKGTAEETAEIGRLSKDLGVGVTQLDKFQKMFRLTGGSAQDAAALISNLHQQVTMFKFGEYNEFLGKALGLSPQDFTENFLQNIDIIRKKLNVLYTPQQKEAILNQVGLGNAVRLLRLTDKEYKNLQKSAEETGLVTQGQVDSSLEFYKNMMLVNESFRDLKRELTTLTAPEFSKVMGELTKLLKDKEFRQDMADFFKLILDAIPVMIKGFDIVAKSLSGYHALFSKLKKEWKGAEEQNALDKAYKKGLITKEQYKQSSLEIGKEPFERKENILGSLNVPGNMAFAGATAATNIYSPNITINATTSASPKDIAIAVDKKMKETFNQAKQSQRSGKIS